MQRYTPYQNRLGNEMIKSDKGSYVLYSEAKAIEEDRDKQIDKLSSDLSANITMLARQCDLAREAERNELAAIRDLAIEVANHEATQRSLFACNSGIMEDEKQIASLTSDIEILRNMNRILKESLVKLRTEVADYREVLEQIHVRALLKYQVRIQAIADAVLLKYDDLKEPEVKI